METKLFLEKLKTIYNFSVANGLYTVHFDFRFGEVSDTYFE